MRVVRVPLDAVTAMNVYHILTLLEFNVEIENDYKDNSMIIRVYEEEKYYGKINLVRELD